MSHCWTLGREGLGARPGFFSALACVMVLLLYFVFHLCNKPQYGCMLT